MIKYYILYKDKIIRKGRLQDCVPQSFIDKEEAEKFVLDMRCILIDQGISAHRWGFYIFSSETNLDEPQME